MNAVPDHNRKVYAIRDVVYGIVKQTGGSIDVKSAVGAGTEFVLKFPSCGEAHRKTSRSSVHRTNGSEKILVVDDEPEMLRLLEHGLGELGYSIVCAKNGIE